MRWDAQALKPAPEAKAPKTGSARDSAPGGGSPGQPGGRSQSPAADALLPLIGLVRSVTTPEFAGVTFHEVTAKSVLNKVAAGSRMPFEWTINPYRGCSHACVYCFARKSHTYLDFDAGLDFDSQVVVKINAAEVLRRELAKPSWGRQHVALGTNTDPYQRAEGRYQLMPGIIGALADSGTPLSILTKGTLLARDIPLLNMPPPRCPSGGHLAGHDGRSPVRGRGARDARSPGTLEAGLPASRSRPPCGVMAMPILPWLSDSDEALDSLFASLAAAGATGVTAGALYLKPGTREWFMQWIAAEHPQLAGSTAGCTGQAPTRPRSTGTGFRAASATSKPAMASPARRASATATSTATRPTTIPQGSIDPRDEEAQYPAGSIPEAAALPGGARPATAAAPPTLF